MLTDGKAVFLPRTIPKDSRIEIAQIHDLEKDTRPGNLGIREPNPESGLLENPDELDLLIIPGVVFDENLSRLGHGRGFFDRFLSQIKGKKPIWALALAEQVFHFVPQFEHDVKPDLLFTPKAVFGKKLAPQ